MLRNAWQSMTSLYVTVKWRTARQARFKFRNLLAAELVVALTSIVLTYFPLTEWIQPGVQGDLADSFAFLLIATAVPMPWSRLHLGRQRVSLNLFIENKSEVSFHWTPLPGWIAWMVRWLTRSDGAGATSIPRRAALAQLTEWIAHAHAHGFRRLSLESPLFVRLDAKGMPVWRNRLTQLAEVFERMPIVDRIEYVQVAPLKSSSVLAYRLFWPRASSNACRSHDGGILATRIIIHLSHGSNPQETTERLNFRE